MMTTSTTSATLSIFRHRSPAGDEQQFFHFCLADQIGAQVKWGRMDNAWRTKLDSELLATVRQIYEFAAFTHSTQGSNTQTAGTQSAGTQSAGATNKSDPLRGLGWQIWQIVPTPIQESLKQLPTGATLILALDDMSIPWELAFDGQSYLCLRLCTARVPLNHAWPTLAPAPQPDQWKALLLGNPTGDLSFATEEIDAIDQLMAPHADQLFSQRVSKKMVAEKLLSAQYHLIHYSGHAEMTAGGEAALLLAGREPLTAREIAANLKGHPWIVLNACSSAQTPSTTQAIESGSTSLVLAFLQSGAQVVIGTQWPIPDGRAKEFAQLLYRPLLKGEAVAEAMRRAREEYRQSRPNDPLWATYLLFGAPHARFVAPTGWQQESGIAVAIFLHQFWNANEHINQAELAPQIQKLFDLMEDYARPNKVQTIERGTEQWVGYFGLHARSAIEFGLNVRKIVQRWARGVQITVNEKLTVGVGIALDSMARYDEGAPAYWGVAAARALRLAQSAQGGEVLADHSVLAGMSGRYHLEEWSGRTLDLSLAQLPAMAVTKRYMDLKVDQTVALVGGRHQRIVSDLDYFLGNARLDQRCQLFTISGPSGVGKSRILAEWLGRDTAAKGHAIYLLCPDRSTHYGVIAQLLRRLLNLGEDGRPPSQAVVAEHLSALSVDKPLQMIILMILGVVEMPSMPNISEWITIHQKLASFIKTLFATVQAQAQTSIVIIDDCQMMDEQSAEVLAMLMDKMSSARALFVLAHHPNWEFKVPQDIQMQKYPLALLELAEAKQLVRQHLSSTTNEKAASGKVVDDQVVDAIAEWVPANPLTLEQVILVLNSRQILLEREGAWVLDRPLAQAEVPKTITGLIAERLAMLSADLREMIEAVAVLGTCALDLHINLLCRNSNEIIAENGLERLQEAGYIVEDRTLNEVRFVHDVVAREINQSLSPVRQRELHWKAMESWSMRADTDPLRIQAQAFHVLQSLGDPLTNPNWQRDLADVTDTRLKSAVNLLRAAADLAQRRSAGREATTAYQQALAFADRLARQTKALADHCVAADIARALARAYMTWGNQLEKALASMKAAWQWLDEATQLQETELDSHAIKRVAAMIHIHTASIHYFQGDFERGEQEAQQGLLVAEEIGDLAAVADAANILGVMNDVRSNTTEALRFYGRSADLHRQLNNPYELARVRDNQATTLFRQGEWASAAALEQEGLAYWQGLDDRAKQALSTMNMTEREAFQGLWETAEEHIRFAVEAHTSIEDYRNLALSYTNWGNLRILQGRLDEAEQCFHQAQTLLNLHAVRDIPIETLCGLSDVARLRYDLAQATQHIEQAFEILAEEEGLYRDQSIALRLQGLIGLARGDFAEARQKLHLSLDLAERYGIRFEVGRVEIALAQLCVAEGDNEGARHHLQQAETIMQKLEARPFLAQIEDARAALPK